MACCAAADTARQPDFAQHQGQVGPAQHFGHQPVSTTITALSEGKIMEVFISWSGDRSEKVAEALRDWLPSVIQSVNPFMSASDIEQGSRWLNDLGIHLENAQFGLICLTQENLKAPWLLFEAGASHRQTNHRPDNLHCSRRQSDEASDVRPRRNCVARKPSDSRPCNPLVHYSAPE